MSEHVADLARAFPGGISAALRAAAIRWRALPASAQLALLSRPRAAVGEGVRIAGGVGAAFRAEVAPFGLGPSAALGRLLEDLLDPRPTTAQLASPPFSPSASSNREEVLHATP